MLAKLESARYRCAEFVCFNCGIVGGLDVVVTRDGMFSQNLFRRFNAKLTELAKRSPVERLVSFVILFACENKRY